MAKTTSKTTKKAKKASSFKKTISPNAGITLSFIIDGAQALMDTFTKEQNVNSTITAAERKRLIGTGVKNYGFIDKAYDIARDNPKFLPSYIDVQEIWQDMHDFEEMRQLVMVLEKFLELANECMLVRGNKCFHDALHVYGALKEMTKSHVPGAKPLFESLVSFFRKRRKNGEENTTIKQLDKDYNSLKRGTKSGEIVVKNEKARTIKGKRVIIDKTSGRGAINRALTEETEEGEIE